MRTLPEAAAPADASATPHLRVLLVDDHEDTNRSLILLLRRRGYEVDAATSLASAVELVSEAEPFDVLVADMGLPDGNGLDLLPQLSPRPRFGGIVVSGFAPTEDSERLKASGYGMHLCKPVDVARLDAAIQHLVHEASG